MKKVLGILAGVGLAAAIGCAQSYDLRIEDTVKRKIYQRDLDKNTEEPPAKSNLVNAKVYIRTPKGVTGPRDAFAFVVEPGKFDIADTFIDEGKQVSLHILARTNAPKGATPTTGTSGDFTADVLDFIKGAYGTDIESSQLKPTEPNSHGRKGLTYRSATLDLANKEVKVYFYGDKNGPGQVALVFEGPKEALRSLSSQIDYSLNSLALGPMASSRYNGQQDEMAAEEGATAPPSGVF
jgi:hypothetical protein